jgi:hypothetical protein
MAEDGPSGLLANINKAISWIRNQNVFQPNHIAPSARAAEHVRDSDVSVADVYEVRQILISLGLPAEVACMVIDFAEYCRFTPWIDTLSEHQTD